MDPLSARPQDSCGGGIIDLRDIVNDRDEQKEQTVSLSSLSQTR